MGTDIDRPSSWIKYRQDLCRNCRASCCMMPVEVKLDDFVRLGLVSKDETLGSIKKIFKNLKKLGVVTSFRASTGLFMLTQKRLRDCYFLDPTSRLCSVYAKRPEVCRQFPSIGPKPDYCPWSPKD